ncbi:MAG: Na/Pi cotransporter family protein, partial [Lachnospiraceae bacterium]|nr:Na/Pi cotransporter family protein [Lachnospiraceae bacterium]
MDIFNVLGLMGGLALFLYGMQVLGDALSRASGGRMEKILEKMTSNPIKGVLLGALVTGVIQSSSATTVMVVGFVNAGIMKLSQTVGIIMGANIGTTVTSWLLSLVGIESDNLIMQLFKPTSFSPILAFIGILLLMISKKEKVKDVGTILLGFAVLMFGMDTMSSAVKPLADVPEFTGILTMFSHPLLGLIAGLVLTAIIQSSSASVGILQALCVTGAIPFSVVFPIIMGQNIGTCVTALLSGIGASKNARRASLIHLYFNVIGTLIFMILFYTVNAFAQFSFFDDTATPMGIAIVHSVFNVTATIILLPFGKLLEKLACLTIKDDPKKEEAEKVDRFSILDDRFLDTPGLAMEQCQNAALDMANLAKDAFLAAHGLFESFSEEKLMAVKEQEDLLDRYEDELGSYLVKLSGKNLSEKDSH